MEVKGVAVDDGLLGALASWAHALTILLRLKLAGVNAV